MIREIKHLYIAVAIAFFVSTAFVSVASSQNVLGEILNRMEVHNNALKSMTAGVSMEKYNSQLKLADPPNVGTTSYISKSVNGKMYVRIDWTKPVQEQIAVIGDDYELYRPRLNQVIYGKSQGAKNSASAGGALAFMTMSKAQLKSNYNIAYLGEVEIGGSIRTWHLQLTPKSQTSYKVAELWVDGDGMPRQAKVTERNDDTSTITLSNIVKNPSLKGSMFKLNTGSAKRVKA